MLYNLHYKSIFTEMLHQLTGSVWKLHRCLGLSENVKKITVSDDKDEKQPYRNSNSKVEELKLHAGTRREQFLSRESSYLSIGCHSVIRTST